LLSDKQSTESGFWQVRLNIGLNIDFLLVLDGRPTEHESAQRGKP